MEVMIEGGCGCSRVSIHVHKYTCLPRGAMQTQRIEQHDYNAQRVAEHTSSSPHPMRYGGWIAGTRRIQRNMYVSRAHNE